MNFTEDEKDLIKEALRNYLQKCKEIFFKTKDKYVEYYFNEEMKKTYTLLNKIDTHGSTIDKEL